MDFRFTQDQQDLIDAARAVFDGEYSLDRLRAMVAGDPVSNLWPVFADMGLISLMLPEAHGGLEQNLAVMAAIAEGSAYAGIAEPLVELAGIVVPLLAEMGETAALSGVVSGEKPVGLITAGLDYVNWAQFAEHFIVTSDAGARLVTKDDIALTPVQSIDPLRSLSKADISGAHHALADYHGAVLTAAQLVGLSQLMLDMSVSYSQDRQQFGKPIGSFQAVKHHLADVHTQIEFTRPIISLAALKGGAAVHTAKIAAIDTAMLAAETAIQVHGAMGYTFEVDLHLFMKRAWALCAVWGDRNYHMKKLEDYILDGPAALGPGHTFSDI